MKNFLDALLKTVFGTFFVLTSVYCLLAYLPYTYYAVIKAPTYSWLPGFAQHHGLLFWMTSFAGAVAYRDRKKSVAYVACFGVLGCLGIFLSLHPLLVHIENNQSAYWEAIAALWIVILVVSCCSIKAGKTSIGETTSDASVSFIVGLVAAIGLALLNIVAAQSPLHAKSSAPELSNITISLTTWSVACHVLIALVLVAIINLVCMASAKVRHPRAARQMAFGLLVFGSLWGLSVRFLASALSLDGWQAHLYAVSLAATLTLLGFSVLRPFLARTGLPSRAMIAWQKIASLVVLVALAFVTVKLPRWVGTEDWNGFIHGTVTLAIWFAASACLFHLLPRTGKYSVKLIFETVLLGFLAYGTLVSTDLVWSWPLGDTNADIQQSLETYAERDPSFNLAYRLRGQKVGESCSVFCQTLRQYSNIRDASARFDVKLVDPLVPVHGYRPNIFFFVIDSMRPDYLGAYNPKANFTPNMDALARDSVVLHNVYTPYAGTSLSEPAIWAGTLLLHAHYMRPFARVNGLEKLVTADDYQMVVSYDDILREILSPSDDMIKLDTEEPKWTQQELCSTVQQAEKTIGQRADPTRPIFFYTQPKNVHQMADNDLPKNGGANFSVPPVFLYEIALKVHQVDTCLGGFIGWLKSRNLYDNSILIVTSDHGQATGQYGRAGHSLIIYPQDMRVPLIVHLPKSMQGKYVYDDSRVGTLIDITPSLYYLLGHRPIIKNPLFGRPLFAQTQDELDGYPRKDLFMASDVLAAYGILADNGRHFYAAYDSPAKSYLYDLERDPDGTHDILTDALKKQYEERVIEHLHQIADFYGYVPGEDMSRTPSSTN